jgi:hypothetical protein
MNVNPNGNASFCKVLNKTRASLSPRRGVNFRNELESCRKRSLPAKALTDKQTRKREVISTSSGFEQLFVSKEEGNEKRNPDLFWEINKAKDFHCIFVGTPALGASHHLRTWRRQCVYVRLAVSFVALQVVQ